ncbi:MAG: hypothetical protein CVV30_11425 [Methanomicrobiales archaeon HGW-Methanomicrobiales-1]|nr:MAG: hypothetical protein CVV30_11425 [Methanomicrobiales archaeon HGW-Methanomicrobiales-1]
MTGKRTPCFGYRSFRPGTPEEILSRSTPSSSIPPHKKNPTQPSSPLRHPGLATTGSRPGKAQINRNKKEPNNFLMTKKVP